MTGLRGGFSRGHWRNWPVLVKLVAVLLVPTLVALTVGVLRIVDQASAAPGYARISQIVGVQHRLSDLISAIQRERDLATAFVARGRTGNQLSLDQQSRTVDDRIANARTAADQLRNLGPTDYATALDDLRGLGPLRQSVTTGVDPAQEVVTEYGAAIDPLIALDAALVRQLNNVAVAADAAAAHALLASREQVSGQYAIVLAALIANRIDPSQIDQVRAAAVRLGTKQEEFAAALNPAQRAGYISRASGDAELSRQRLLQLVLNRGLVNSSLNIAQDDWSQRNAVVEANISNVENTLQQRIDRTAQGLRDDARATAGWNAVVLTFLLALGVFIGILIARSMLRPLGVLQRTALDIAGRRLPAAMAQVREGDVPDQTIEPVAVSTREEIGQVARAFDEVHRQAVLLAGEQARLRAHVNDIFVNLSRRSQSLVERQLQLIDRLESSEQDPEQLDNLFQLDHLATRMRRNSENLLVLAGTDAGKRAGRPVRLVDVLRAAVSEVEQYQRLVLQQPPNVLVLGRTAGDLVHLLAELLDNATQFSPPDTPVMVSAEFAAGGSVGVEVMDRGVGMTDSELTGANERLASTPVVDASVSRRMGLFVVGRLAVRHGIGVRLRRGDDGIGVCAAVSVPPRLVRPASETGDTRTGTAVSAPPAGNGPESDQDDPVLGRSARSGAIVTTREYLTDLGAAAANGNGDRSGGHSSAPDRPDSTLPRRTGDQSRPADRPPGPPASSGPPASPPSAVPSAESARNLFRPGGPGRAAAPAGLGAAGPLQRSTPIFDDVASAWFQEHQAVPVQWATASSPARQVASDGPAADAVAAGSPAPQAVEQDPDPEPEPDPDPVPVPVPVPLEVMRAAGAQPAEWGAVDEGWRAAQVSAESVSTGVTAAGLPRRKPQALLVPGAVGGAAPTAPTSAPVRSAELIRGRLASYQRGIRAGRRTRRSPGPDAGGPYPQQSTAEETT